MYTVVVELEPSHPEINIRQPTENDGRDTQPRKKYDNNVKGRYFRFHYDNTMKHKYILSAIEN